MSQVTHSETGESSSNRNPAQLIPPYVDTRMKIDGYPIKKFATVFAPGGAMMFVALGAALFSISWLFWSLLLVFIPLSLAVGGYIAVTSDWHTPPRERFQNWRAHRSLQNSVPWDDTDTIAHDIAGVEVLLDDGTARTTDDRLVVPVYVSGRSTDRLTERKTNDLINQLGDVIDEEIKDFDFRLYSTTVPGDSDDLAETYHRRAEADAFQGHEHLYLRELLHNVGDWLKQVDEPMWDAPEWRHYVVIEVSLDAVGAAGYGTAPSLWSMINPFDNTRTIAEQQRQRAAQRELRKRVKTVEDGISSVDGLTAEKISPDEHAYLLLKYWTGEHHDPDEELQRVFERSQTGPTIWPPARSMSTSDDKLSLQDGPEDERTAVVDEPGNTTAAARLFGGFKRLTPGLAATTPTKDAETEPEAVGFVPPGDDHEEASVRKMLAPGVFDVSRDHIRVGDTVCRTYWIVEWPTQPNSLFLQRLYTTYGADIEAERNPDAAHDIDLDVNVRVRSVDRGSVMRTLQKQWGSIGAEGLERSEDGGDVSALGVDVDQDIYTQMYELLRTTNAQPWRVSAYVTVRAGERHAVDTFEDVLVEHASIEGAALDALRRRSEQVRKRLESAPMNLTPRAGHERHLEAFTSCSPNGRDEFVEVADRNLKTRPMLGHAVASIFPFCGETIHEDGGLDFGRNLENGTHLKIDPFNRGVSPHMITIGTSRSGKTTFASQAVERWYAEKDDRTLIVLDTQGGFDGLTKTLGGKHIVIGGGEGVNPFHIEPPAEHEQHTGGTASPFNMKSSAVTNFIIGVIRSQGVDPAPYTNTIEQLVRRTFIEAGIEPGNPESHENQSPTMRDFINTALELKNEPSPLTHGEDEDVTMNKEQAIAGLLDLLGGFKEGQKYEYLLDEDATGLMDESEMAYIDLRQFRDSSAAEKSAMFRLMLDQVNQKIKRTEGETMFLIDEAHFLLHSPEMVNWLEKAAREWARYDACLWFASQSPREFVQQVESGENKRRTIRDQCSVVQFFRTSRADDDTLAEFGLNPKQIEFIKNDAVPGKAGAGYTECLTALDDRDGWLPGYIELSSFELDLLNYRPREHGDFVTYMNKLTGVHPEEAYEPSPEHAPPVEDSAPSNSTYEMIAATDGHGDDAAPEPIDTTHAAVEPTTTTTTRSQATNGETPASESVTSVPTSETTASGSEPPPDSSSIQRKDSPPPASNNASESEASTVEADAETEGGTESEPTSTASSASDSKPEPNTDASRSGQAVATDSEATTSGADDTAGIASRVKTRLGSIFPHPAAGKSQPDLTDIGIVETPTATALRAAGFETVTAVYEAEPSALAEAPSIDKPKADYLQSAAEYALEAAETTVPDDNGIEASTDSAATHGREGVGGSEETDGTPSDSDTAALDERASETPPSIEEHQSNGDDHATLTDIKHLGESRANTLRSAGYDSVADVASVEPDALTEIDGIGKLRAKEMNESAYILLEEPSKGSTTDDRGKDEA